MGEALKSAVISDLSNNTPAFGSHLANSIFHLAGTCDAHLDDDMDRTMSLCSFFERPYWERMWIVQEVVLAQRGLVLCGTDTLSLEDLWLGMMALQGTAMHGNHISLRERANMGYTHSILKHMKVKIRHEMAKLGEFLQSNPPSSVPLTSLGLLAIRLHLPTGPPSSHNMTLWDLLEATESLKSTNPRDRIYSVLGLLGAEHDSINPDYNLPVSKVYTETMLSEIRTSGSLSAVTFAGTGLSTTTERIPGLPSWVVDFSTRWKTHPPCSNFTAGSTLPSNTTPNDFGELRSTGIICDGIRSITSIPSKEREDHWDVYSVINEFVRFIRDEGTALDVSQVQPQCVPWIQVLFRNIICDSTNTHETSGQYPQRIMPMLFSFGENMVSLIARSELGGDTVASLLLSPNNYDQLQPVLQNSQMSLDEKWPIIRTSVFNELFGPEENNSPRNTSSTSPSTSIDLSMDKGELGLIDCLLGLFRAKSHFIISNRGFMGFVPMGTRKGDSLCILSQCPMPLVVRPDGDKFELVGRAYVHGMMQGEIVQHLESFNEQQNLGTNVAENPYIREICLI